MPRYAWDPRRRRMPSVGNSAALAIVDPGPRLAKIASGALRKVAEFIPGSKKGHAWQADAFTYNELVAEIGALHSLTAETVSACDLRVVTMEPGDSDTHTTESIDPRVIRVMRAFNGPVGGVKELKRKAALHYQVAGESILTGTPMKNEVGADVGIAWEFLSPLELKFEEKKGTDPLTGKPNKTVTVKRQSDSPAQDGEFKDEDIFTARFYRSDPAFSGRADSPMKRILPLCRELVVLSEVVDAIAKSRLPAGMIFIPEEMSFGPDDETMEEGGDEDGEVIDDADRFTETLVGHMSAPIEDRTSAAGLVPLVITGPADLGEKIKEIPLARDLPKFAQELRSELLRRIAQGLDAPPEVMSGKAQLNHWSSYSVDTDFVNKYVNPIGEALAAFLTVAYLRPMLTRHEGMSAEEAARYTLEFDTSPITQRMDEAAAAKNAWDRDLISDEAYLRSHGYTDEALPTTDERKRRMLERILASDPARLAPYILPLLYPELAGKLDGLLEPDESSQIEDVQDRPGANPIQGPPKALPEAPDDGTPPTGNSLESELERAATEALQKAIEGAGTRLLSRATGFSTQHAERFRSLAPAKRLSAVAEGDLVNMRLTVNDLFEGAWDDLAEQAEKAAWNAVADLNLHPNARQQYASSVALEMVREVDALARGMVGVNGMTSALDSRSIEAIVSRVAPR